MKYLFACILATATCFAQFDPLNPKIQGVTLLTKTNASGIGSFTTTGMATAPSATLTGLTPAGIVFPTTGGLLTQDSSNLVFDAVNIRLGIGTNAPANMVSVWRDTNATVTVEVANKSDGASAQTVFLARSTNGTLSTFSASPNYTGIAEFANKAGIYTSTAMGNVVIAARGAAAGVDFYAGGSGSGNKWMTLSSAGALALTGSLAVGGGTAIAAIRTASAALDFGSILAAASADLTITVTGAAVNDAVVLGLPAAPDPSITFSCFVSAANTVTVRAYNVGAIAVDQASAIFRATVIGY